MIPHAATDLARGLVAEVLKLRRTPALLLALITPYVVALLQALVAYHLGKRLLASPGFDAWAWMGRNALVMWAGLVLPLLIALEAALLADVESRARGFKHLFALPVRRGALVVAKLAALVLLMVLATALLGVGLWLAGRGLHALEPGLGFGAPFAAGQWTMQALAVLAAGGVLLPLHGWLSLRGMSFAAAIGLAVAGTVAGSALLRLGEGPWTWLPWSMPLRVLGTGDGGLDPATLTAGLVAGALLALVAVTDLARRDVLE